MLAKKVFIAVIIIVLTVKTRVFPNAEENPIVISLRAITGLQFDQPRFSVKPGSLVKIILTNSDDMSHNLVFTSPGSRQEVVDAALRLGDKGPALNYIPKHPAILWSIPVLPPGESKVITFIAPEEPGIYPYVCTYPGHGFVMYGAMYVTREEMPPIENDLNIPPNRRDDNITTSTNTHAGHVQPASHPYNDIPPYLYRVFIEDSGPATIAVRLPENVSYFWDAGACRLRFATEGDFLDMKELWAGHRQAVATNLGTVFFRDKTEYPLRIGREANIPDVKFKGYRLTDRYPEFHYLLNGLDVYELIRQKPNATGLVRIFRIPEANQNVWFVFNPDDSVSYTSSAGKWSKGRLMLTPAEARQFTVTISKIRGSLL